MSAAFDIDETFLSQYVAPAVVIPAIIESFSAATIRAMETAFDDFLADYWNINTAVYTGLDNWGEILGISRYVRLPVIGSFVGFYNSENDYQPMSQAPFYAGGPSEQAYALSDSAYRPLLLAKALANISTSSIPDLNRITQVAFGVGAMFVVDFGDMGMAYVFTTTPTPVQKAIAENSGVLPHPTGVSTEVITAILANAQLLAGTSGSDIGYGSGFGSLTPNVDVNSNDVTALYTDSGSLILEISSTAGADITTEAGVDIETESGEQITTEGLPLSSSYFTYLLIDGIVLIAAAASYSSSGGVSTWTWTDAPIALTGGNTYTILVM